MCRVPYSQRLSLGAIVSVHLHPHMSTPKCDTLESKRSEARVVTAVAAAVAAVATVVALMGLHTSTTVTTSSISSSGAVVSGIAVLLLLWHV
jgi:hypothetical protein